MQVSSRAPCVQLAEHSPCQPELGVPAGISTFVPQEPQRPRPQGCVSQSVVLVGILCPDTLVALGTRLPAMETADHAPLVGHTTGTTCACSFKPSRKPSPPRELT